MIRFLSILFPTLCVILLALLVHSVDGLSATISETARIKQPALPAGIYICDGDRCVIANNSNIDGIGRERSPSSVSAR
jgi:hypothetical protein